MPDLGMLTRWKLVIGQMCQICTGTGNVDVRVLDDKYSPRTCEACRGAGALIRLATRQEALELLKMIPDLVAGELVPPTECPPCDSARTFGSYCPHHSRGEHYPDCSNY